jgi:arsenical pump membrane protein
VQWESLLLRGALGSAFPLGLDVVLASAVAAGVLLVACMIAARHLLTWRLLPWQLVIGVGVLFLLVQFAHDHGLGAALTYVASHGLSGVELVRLSGAGALGANVVDNLPSYLALEPVTMHRRCDWPHS